MRQFLFNPQIVLSTTNLGGREGEVATPSFPIEIPSGNSFLYSLGLILGLHKPDLLIFQLHHKRDQRPAHTFWHLEKQAQVPSPHPGDHSHRPPPGWVGGNNKHTLQLSMHTSSHQSCCCYINKLYRHYNKHSTQTRSVHTAIAMPKEYQYFTS